MPVLVAAPWTNVDWVAVKVLTLCEMTTAKGFCSYVQNINYFCQAQLSAITDASTPHGALLRVINPGLK